MTKKKEGTYSKKELIIGIFFMIFLIGFVCAWLGFDIGKQLGENKACHRDCQPNTTYIPPMYCYEITHNSDGMRCCNWNETILQCGRPLLQIKK